MADHNGEKSEPGIEPSRSILKVVGYAAAAAFCAVSVCANLRYGLSLGKNPMDKATYAIASVAADVLKITAPLLAPSLWDRRFRILAVMGFVLWLGCVSWSMASAAGFVLSSRGDAIADRAAEAATRHGWEAKVERAETQLATLGRHRPFDVIKAELASVAVAPNIWRRSRHCADLALEESRLACAPVLGLRKELAAAEAADRLEGQLVAGRAQLATVPVGGSIADPQASALAKLTGVDEATIRTYVALLLAALIEAGSALGFALVSVATAHNPPPPAPGQVLGPTNTPRLRANAQHASATNSTTRRVQTGLAVGPASHVAERESSTGHSRRRYSGAILSASSPSPAPGSKAWRDAILDATNADAFERWIRERLKVDATGRIPAREAYTDFCRWARAMDIAPGTQTRFGRDFSARIAHLGGKKMKRRDRTYYEGVGLTVPIMGVPALKS
jgi:hypothetical protein